MAKPVILVAGGAGYIGAHFCKAAFDAGFSPVVVDRLSAPTPRAEAFRRGAVRWGPLEVADIGDTSAITAIIEKHRPVAAVCFAALIEVSESITLPDLYWENNFIKTARFFLALQKASVTKLVFSSTAAVYGSSQNGTALVETDPLAPINTYGMTKLGCEAMLQGNGAEHPDLQKRMEDFSALEAMESVIFRYFNAAGADHESGLGEMHEPETHVIPNAIFAGLGLRGYAAGKKTFSILGTDFPTPDGTAIRDFVHVNDLAAAHVTALRYLLDGGTRDTFNLGTHQGTSVRQVVEAARRATGHAFPVTETARRAGDPPMLVADAGKARAVLGWSPRHDLESIIASACAFHKKQG